MEVVNDGVVVRLDDSCVSGEAELDDSVGTPPEDGISEIGTFEEEEEVVEDVWTGGVVVVSAI